jgi:ribonuclease HI
MALDSFQATTTKIEIYTAGSCIRNPGSGGYAFRARFISAEGQVLKVDTQSFSEAETTTNIRMEMMAAIAALETLGEIRDAQIVVISDADLIPKTMNSWLESWKAKGWRKSDKKPVANIDLWQRLDEAAKGRSIEWRSGCSHTDQEHKAEADRFARRAADEATLAG